MNKVSLPASSLKVLERKVEVSRHKASYVLTVISIVSPQGSNLLETLLKAQSLVFHLGTQATITGTATIITILDIRIPVQTAVIVLLNITTATLTVIPDIVVT